MNERPKTTAEFEARFDDGEDMAKWVDWDDSRRPPGEAQSAIDDAVPLALLSRIEAAAKARGLSRSDLIQRWLTEKLDEAA